VTDASFATKRAASTDSVTDMGRVAFVLSEVWAGLRRSFTLTIATIITFAVSLTLFGTALLVGAQVNQMKDYWSSRVQVSVFLCGQSSLPTSCPQGPITLAQKSQVQQTLQSLPVVKQIYYESQQEAYQHFLQRFRGTTIAQTVTPADLPESFRVSLNDASKFTQVADAVQHLPGVDIVKDQRDQNKRLFALLDGLRWLALGFAIAMLLATMLLVVNTMRVAAYSRRREVGIMRLVGASNGYIRLPFLLEAAFAALGGIVITVAVLVGVKTGLVDAVLAPTYKFTSFIGWGPVWQACALVAVVGLGLGVLTAGASLRRYLKS